MLYDAAATNYSSDFFDVTGGENDYTVDGYRGGLYAAGTGYDMASGLGTPNASNLSAEICSLRNTVTVSNPGSQSSITDNAVSLQLQGSDSDSGQTLTWSAMGLPSGLSISPSTGLISGTPSATGSFSVTVTARDTTAASGSTSFTWSVAGIAVTNPGYPGANVGNIFNLQMNATDTTSGQTLTWSATGLPSGTTISASTGLVSGTPSATGSSSVTVTAEDSTGVTGSTSFTLSVYVDGTTPSFKFSSATIIYGQEQVETISVQVRGGGTGIPTGTVYVKSGTVTICSLTLVNEHASCKLTPKKLAVGAHSLWVQYPGNANYGGSSTSNKTLTVKK